MYLDKVLARYNLDSRRTHDEAISPQVYSESAFINLKELSRLTKAGLFTLKEKEQITQKVLINLEKDLASFTTNRTKVMLIMLNFIKLLSLKNILTSILSDRQIRFLKRILRRLHA